MKTIKFKFRKIPPDGFDDWWECGYGEDMTGTYVLATKAAEQIEYEQTRNKNNVSMYDDALKRVKQERNEAVRIISNLIWELSHGDRVKINDLAEEARAFLERMEVKQ